MTCLRLPTCHLPEPGFKLSLPNSRVLPLCFFFLFVCLFLNQLILTALDLRCCVKAFSTCFEQGYSSLQCEVSHCDGFSCCRAQALECGLQYLWLPGLVAPRHVKSSRTGIEHVSPALAGRFSTIGPPGKS